MSTTKTKQKKEDKQPTRAEVAKQEREAHGLAIVKATQKGIALARKAFGSDGLTENLGAALARGVNKNIAITSTGLKVKAGYQPTETEITEVLSGLCGINEETGKFKTVTTWAIGDAAILADHIDGGVDRVVAQAVSERGVSKHTVMQSAAVCRIFSNGERIPNLSFTHHQELANYKKAIKNKKGYESLIKELKEGAKKDEAMSCSELRQRLQILSGKKDEEEKDGEKSKKAHTFLYISEDSEVTKSEGLDKDLCKAGNHLVIDVTAMAVIKGNGTVHYEIPGTKQEGPKDEAPAETKEEPKQEEKKAKASKPKAKAKNSTEIPD